ncbi:MAG: hypothetical protein OEM49_08350 [Myxococcales bacterium]|nr:hypothetical protein [Myxococcales bacterium]
MERIGLVDPRPLLLVCAALLVLLPSQPSWGQTPEGIGMLPRVVGGSGSVIDEDEWAALLIEALGLDDALQAGEGSVDAFSLLCADAAELVTDAEGRRVPADAAFAVASEVTPARNPGDPVRVVLDIPATALYQLSVEGEGLQRWTADQRVIGHLDPTSLGVALAPTLVPLRKGSHELAGYMGRRARAERIELSAFRPLCIAPADGWHAERPLSHGAAARTLVRALGLERYLPRLGDNVEIEGESFASASGWGGRTNETQGAKVSGDAWARAGDSAAEFEYRIHLDEPGVFSLFARTRGAEAQLWSIDGRYRIGARAESRGARFSWIHLMTTPLGSGEHAIRALVPRGGGIDVIRVTRHRATSVHYVDVLEQMGFRGGAPDALVTREVALGNLLRPAFAELAAEFRERMAQGGPDEPIVAVDGALPPLYSRPLSPSLPSEL